MTTGALGTAYLMRGDRRAAIHWFIDGVFKMAREIGDELAMTLTLPAAAMAAIEGGRPEVGTMVMGAHESLSRTYGVRSPVALQLVFEEFAPLERHGYSSSRWTSSPRWSVAAGCGSRR